MSVFSIGDERFLEMSAPPEVWLCGLEIVNRPGINGSGFWETGWRGEPFEVVTSVDAADAAAAYDTYTRYAVLTYADPLDVVYLGNPLAAYGFQFQVIKVRPMAIHALAASSGGLNPPGLGWCQCRWRLVPVYTATIQGA